ncbi:MAG: SAM-dependent methyltransferase [Mycobacterium sp.]
MSRTDDDSWDITEGVGATALSVARARAAESGQRTPLFTDPYAGFFVEAALAAGWQSSFAAETLAEVRYMQVMAAYIAARTKYFDEFFGTAGAHGVDQVVILAAGLDTRAWRLSWISGTVVYELDQPKVLEFKDDVLRRHGAEPMARHVPIPIDLRHDWPKALRDKGFDPGRPTAWLAEGLLPYLSAADQDLLFARISELSAAGSRIAVEAFTPEFFDPVNLKSRRDRLLQATAAAGRDVPETEKLWYLEPRTDVVEWLGRHGWDVAAIRSPELLAHYRRPVPEDAGDAVPGSVFVQGYLTK